jgi:hypothetical protein
MTNQRSAILAFQNNNLKIGSNSPTFRKMARAVGARDWVCPEHPAVKVVLNHSRREAMIKCTHCGWHEELPPADLLTRGGCTHRVYVALQNGEKTAAELREVAWQDGRPRTDGAMHIIWRRSVMRSAAASARAAASGSRSKPFGLWSN